MRLTLPALALLFACTPSPRSTPSPLPRDGVEVLTRMHDAYAGKWYRTVTFTQTTTQHAPDGRERVSTWHEALLAPSTLRIDIGDPADGNVVIYTADSSYRVRGGKLVRAEADANPFMPFVSSLYHVPVSRTLNDIARWKFDLTKVRADVRDGRPIWVVGATEASDTTSPQFWVDAERLVTTRLILGPDGNQPALDISLGGYQPAGEGWIATDVDMRSGGKSVQREQYADVRANVELPVSMFDPHQWAVATASSGAETTVILVRHAEKIDASADAALSDAGTRRARALADSLARMRIGGIITTQFQRTQLTAQPLAERLGLTPVIVNAGAGAPDHVAAVVATIRNQFAGRAVLVVGHSNTVPAIIRALGVSEPVTIPDEAYDDFFVVRARPDGTATLVRSRYGEPSSASPAMR
ncbi:MAG TPA: histidine phosphatase family protein [Gemmatimonadaceae bacterium]|nr:histidine phosphatase family protein [Gemmatimonadaceae bacterium]